MTGNEIWPTPELDRAPLARGLNNPHRIFVLESDADIARLDLEILQDSGYQVKIAEDGAVAWDALQINTYDLFIAEHKTIKLSGLDLLKKLHLAKIVLPTILVAAVPLQSEIKRCPWLPIEAVLLKPYTADELLATVRNVLFAIEHIGAQLTQSPYWQTPPLTNRLRA